MDAFLHALWAWLMARMEILAFRRKTHDTEEIGVSAKLCRLLDNGNSRKRRH